MQSNDELQEVIIDYLKAQASLTPYQDEIREEHWQGVTIRYPNIRVSLGVQVPVQNCNLATLTFKIICSSNLDSSQEADRIAGLVNTALHDKSFSWVIESGDTVRFNGCKSTGLESARRVDEHRWVANANFRVMVS